MPEVDQKWYSYALAFSRAPAEVRKEVSDQRRSWYARIARIHPQIGAKLDDLLAPLDVCRKIAYANGYAAQHARAVELLAELVEKRKPKLRAG